MGSSATTTAAVSVLNFTCSDADSCPTVSHRGSSDGSSPTTISLSSVVANTISEIRSSTSDAADSAPARISMASTDLQHGIATPRPTTDTTTHSEQSINVPPDPPDSEMSDLISDPGHFNSLAPPSQPTVVNHSSVSAPSFIWGELDDESFCQAIKAAYSETRKWKKKLFPVPHSGIEGPLPTFRETTPPMGER